MTHYKSFECYIRYLIKYHSYSRNDAELLIDDIAGIILWYEFTGKNIYKYLSSIVNDSYTYSDHLNLI